MGHSYYRFLRFFSQLVKYLSLLPRKMSSQDVYFMVRDCVSNSATILESEKMLLLQLKHLQEPASSNSGISGNGH